MMETERQSWDLYEAAFLIAQKFQLKRVDPSHNRRRCYFIFDDTPECKKASFDYWTKQASVEPKTYAEAIRYLKDLLHADVQLAFPKI